MSERVYRVGPVRPLDGDALSECFALLLLHANKIPPHIAIAFGGRYFSLSAKERSVGTDAGLIRKAVFQRPIPTLTVEIQGQRSSDPQDPLALLERVFTEAPALDEKAGVTCLTPVKHFFREWGGIDDKAVALVFDLLDQLDEAGLIGGYRHYALFNDREMHPEFRLPHYTLADVHQRIGRLARTSKT